MADEQEKEGELSLLAFLTLHQILLEGLKKGRQMELAQYVRDIEKAVRTRLMALDVDSLDKLAASKLRALVKALREALVGIGSRFVSGFMSFLEKFSAEDNKTFRLIMANEFPVKGETLVKPELIWKETQAAPIPASGATMIDALKAYVAANVARVILEIQKSVANARTVAETLKAIVGTKAINFRDGLLARIRREGNATTDTLMQHVSAMAQARNERARFKWYEWVSILDDRTTEICRARDGKRFIYGEGPLPPAHYRCRSKAVPVRNVNDDTYDPPSMGEWAKRLPGRIRDAVFGSKGGVNLDDVPGITLERYSQLRGTIFKPEQDK